MKTKSVWSEKVVDITEQCIYDLCFNPDGKQIILAAGQNVMVYNSSGSLIQILRGHKDTVYCVSYAKDGKKFASGSGDKNVILWNNKLEGILKYSQNDSVQSMQFNPVTHQLLSCSLSDIAIWSADQKAIQRIKSSGRVNCCSWTRDGQYMALAMATGYVSIRYKTGDEILRIERSGESPIWTLSWGIAKDDSTDVLCVGEWNGTLSFYNLNGKTNSKDRTLPFVPLKIAYFPCGQYILVTGSNKQCLLLSGDGIQLAEIGTFNSWTWCCAVHPDAQHVVIGCQDGTLTKIKLDWVTVNGMYKERFAYRENMTDVIIQDLVSSQKVRIKCKDLIKKISLYRDRLAVQLSDKVVIYEPSNNSEIMHYRIKEKITFNKQCDFLEVTTNNLISCQGKRLQSFTFMGEIDREWIMNTTITCLKVIGGPTGRECVIVGLENGQVTEIFLDNPFSSILATVEGSIRSVDVSSMKEKMAVVSSLDVLHVIDIHNDKKLEEYQNVSSAAFNSAFEDMMCFAGKDLLTIKVANFSEYKFKFSGVVVAVNGSKVHCLNGGSMGTIEIPLSSLMYQYLDAELFDKAYAIACLGVTDSDWYALGVAALNSLEFNIAYAAFSKTKKMQLVEIVSEIEDKLKTGEFSKEACRATAAAAMGKLRDAAKLYQKAGLQHEALNMYSDLRMFDSAQEFIASGNNQDKKTLLRKRAEWAKSLGEPRAAAEMFLSAGDLNKAIQIISEHGWVDMLIKVGRQLDKAERDSLSLIAKKLRQLGATHGAAEIYGRLGDDTDVADVLVDAQAWSDAFELVERNSKLKSRVYGPYARWLAENGRFSEAQKAFQMAGRPEESIQVLNVLSKNAIQEKRFKDASYFYWLISQIILDLSKSTDEIKTLFMLCYDKADIYYAYHEIYRYLHEPFTSLMPEALFNISKYLLTKINTSEIEGVSKLTIMYTLVKQARMLGAYKLAMQLLDRLKRMKIPKHLLAQIESWMISTKAYPYRDPEELLPLCNRCSTYNSLLPTSDSPGNCCGKCGLKFQYSFVMFEILPLVEFELEKGISDEEAEKLINEPVESTNFVTVEDQMTINNTDTDLFMAKLVQYEEKVDSTITVGRAVLKNMVPSNVIIVKWPKPFQRKYYRNLLPDIQITVCQTCFKLFHTDDYELALLRYNQCPFCRTSSNTNV